MLNYYNNSNFFWNNYKIANDSNFNPNKLAKFVKLYQDPEDNEYEKNKNKSFDGKKKEILNSLKMKII